MSFSPLYTLLLLVCFSAIPLAAALPIPDVDRNIGPGSRQTKRIVPDEFYESLFRAQVNLPTATCSNSGLAIEQFLPFNLSVNAEAFRDLTSGHIYLDDYLLDIGWRNGRAESSQLLHLRGDYPTARPINVSWIGAADMASPQSTYPYPTQVLDFALHEVPTSEDGAIEGGSCSYPNIILTNTPHERSRVLTLVAGEETQTLAQSRIDRPDVPFNLMDDEPSSPLSPIPEDDFDLAGELETLRLLEQDAEGLRTQIAVRKRVISQNIRQRREKLCLQHLLAECDGVLCKAKAVVERICDKMGIDVSSGCDDSSRLDRHVSRLADLESHGHQNHLFGQVALKTNSPLSQKFRRPAIFSEKQGIEGITQPVSNASRNPVVKILAAIAVALGLTAIASFVRYRCMSMRKRVEHAADLEERRNARAYRRAAHAAAVRRRWDGFLKIFSCFHSPEPPRQEDYDEKRALILQDAFLEQDLDLAEKGEIMEAEIRELRHAHEIVASLVRVDEHRYVIASNIHDPPPSLVPLPHTSGARSRASTGTLGTLPSYFSESLPDYTSRRAGSSTASSSDRASDGGSDNSRRASVSSVTQVSTPPTMTQSRVECPAPRSTPTSSVNYASPRMSLDTLFTRQSRQS